MPLGTPVLAGTLSSAVSSSAYAVPVSQPVPPGSAVVVFAGSPGTTAASVADSQGNTYSLAASSAANEWLQAFTATSVTGLNPLAGDAWTVTYSAANTQQKTALAVAVPGAGVLDAGVAANGSSAAPAVSGTAAYGNEMVIGCVQDANAGGAPSSFSLTALGSLSPSGQQFMTCGYGYQPDTGAVTASAAITSAAWAAVLVSFACAPPAAHGPQASPAGGAILPPYPVLPSPQTWTSKTPLLTASLRADPGNALTLLSNPPLLVAGQTVTAQSVPTTTVTPLALDTELTDTWQSHVQPAPQSYPPLAGWYLAEGLVQLNDTVAGTVAAAGLQSVAGGTTVSQDGAKLTAVAGGAPVATVADLIQLSPATLDSIALYAWHNAGAAKAVTSAWLKTEWVCAPSGTVVASPVPSAPYTTGATVLLQPVAAGATQAVVADPSGIVAGGVIRLDTGAAAAEDVTVSSVSGQTIGISATSYPHAAQAAVAVPVSAAFMNQQVRDKIRFLAYRPVARLTSTGTAQAIPSQTFPAGTAITWTNPATSGARMVDNFSGWSSANPTRYTFPLPGVWRLYGQVYTAASAASFTLAAGLAVSGGTVRWGDRAQSPAATAAGGTCATVRRTVRVQAGQYAEVYGSQGSGGSLAVAGSGNIYSKFVAVWRGF